MSEVISDCSRIKFSDDLTKLESHGVKDKTRQKRLGSRNEGQVVNANFNSNGNLNVNSNLKPENANPNLGGRSEIVSCLQEIVTGEIFSSLQTSCPFLGGGLEVLGIVSRPEPEYLWPSG